MRSSVRRLHYLLRESMRPLQEDEQAEGHLLRIRASVRP
jgi:hypothetical protein